MDWFFDGLGTMLIGLVIGAAGGGVTGWKLAVQRTRQSQKAGARSTQVQVGRDYRAGGGPSGV